MRRRSLCLLMACLGLMAVAPAAAVELPPGPNRDLVYGQCRVCHDLQYLKESAGITREDWDIMLDSMRQYGLRLAADQRAKILDYLGTYLGPNPPAAPAAEAQPAEAADGAAVFADQCSACHQANGEGVAGQFPPLAGNRDLFLDESFPVYVVLNGLEGPVSVEGKDFDSVMPPFDHLSDASVAAVVNYVRAAWGNADLRPAAIVDIDATTVEAARAKPMTSEEVHAFRAERKAP